MSKAPRCECCAGTGKKLNHYDVGRKMRELRMSKGLTLKEVVAAIGYTASYLSDLEHGRRSWNTGLIEKYKAACE
jgi:transcriptional regulator with XRE-family HTH domain